MNKNNKLGIVLIVLAILFTIIGSTFAYWSWTTNSSQLTEVTFTIASGFTCGADGGGNITSNDVSLAPAECTNSNYVIKRTVKVSTTQRSGATIYLDMNLKVNSISANLAASPNFKYALTTSSASCESGVMAEGSFNGVSANDELPLLTNERYLKSKANDTFYLWIWLDKEETDNNTQNGTFEFTLSGNCTDQEPAKIYAPWGEEVDQYKRIDFKNISSASNGQGLYVLPATKNDANPIYYYRGNISNNNVIFGNYCWKIVRTTDTGGVKLIYSGTPTSGSCINTTGTDAELSGTNIYYNYDTGMLTGVGYMIGPNEYYSSSFSSSSLNSIYKYGNSFYYSGGTYTLVDTMESTGSWDTDRSNLGNKHYTCFNDTGVCNSLYYIFYTTVSRAYYTTLTGGKSIEEILNESLTYNTISSAIKDFIDEWYEGNLINEESKLEDTVWCNDREPNSLYSFDSSKQYFSATVMTFKPNLRASYGAVPRLSCKHISDSFTKNSVNGNGSLDNPIGLLTMDEVALAGGKNDMGNSSYYLYTGETYWTMTASYYSYYDPYIFQVTSLGSIHSIDLHSKSGVRPSVSLKPGGTWSGDGTSDSPYQVSYS